MRRLMAAIAGLGVLLGAGPASAFCGFYVSGAGTDLYNNATMVVMMRDGTRTVLSMQNNYDGPPEDFAMVVPVPVVLGEEDVKTLPDAIFARVDQLAAPRLVEYWEQDPCAPQVYPAPMAMATGAMPDMAPVEETGGDLGVTVEAEFVVGEYDIAILSANDSSGLDTWLRREGYRIPEGAEPVLRPYVAQGTKFFVARVDVERVTRVDGRAVLSPLRFHYDSETFSLPVRLGLLNSRGQQDLIVHVLARGQRYEVANYDNVMIPTNLVVSHGVRGEFGPFYASLLDRTLERHRGAVVTEYAWDASSCDPCPTPGLTPDEITTLGADVVAADPYGFTLTRLHYRYGRGSRVPRRAAHRRRPRHAGRGGPAHRAGRPAQREQRVPGALRDAQPLAGRGRVRRSATRSLGRAAERRGAAADRGHQHRVRGSLRLARLVPHAGSAGARRGGRGERLRRRLGAADERRARRAPRGRLRELQRRRGLALVRGRGAGGAARAGAALASPLALKRHG